MNVRLVSPHGCLQGRESLQGTLSAPFLKAGLVCRDMHVHARDVVNRKTGAHMERRWIQAVFCLPPGPALDVLVPRGGKRSSGTLPFDFQRMYIDDAGESMKAGNEHYAQRGSQSNWPFEVDEHCKGSVSNFTVRSILFITQLRIVYLVNTSRSIRM
jgi:hypothetical protein